MRPSYFALALATLAMLKFNPLYSWMPLVLAVLLGSSTIISLYQLIVQTARQSSDAFGSRELSLKLIKLLLQDTDVSAVSAKMPIGLGNGAGPQILRQLSRNPQFLQLTNTIRTIGPILCYPAYWVI